MIRVEIIYDIFILKFEQDEAEEEENILNMEALNKLNTIKTVKVMFFFTKKGFFNFLMIYFYYTYRIFKK